MCAEGPADALVNDEMKSVKHYFPDLLSSLKVLIFSGNFDLTIPSAGTEAWLNNIKWPGLNHFQSYLDDYLKVLIFRK
jgi:hypothetical protein